jgi:hypothetical protein
MRTTRPGEAAAAGKIPFENRALRPSLPPESLPGIRTVHERNAKAKPTADFALTRGRIQSFQNCMQMSVSGATKGRCFIENTIS